MFKSRAICTSHTTGGGKKAHKDVIGNGEVVPKQAISAYSVPERPAWGWLGIKKERRQQERVKKDAGGWASRPG